MLLEIAFKSPQGVCQLLINLLHWCFLVILSLQELSLNMKPIIRLMGNQTGLKLLLQLLILLIKAHFQCPTQANLWMLVRRTSLTNHQVTEIYHFQSI